MLWVIDIGAGTHVLAFKVRKERTEVVDRRDKN